MIPATLLQVTNDETVRAACDAAEGADAGIVCRNVYEWTDNETLSRAVEFLASAPLRILLILFFAMVVNRIARRLIRKLVREMSDEEAIERRKAIERITPKSLRQTKEHQPLRSAARAETIGSVLKSVATIIIYSIAVLMALAEIHINLGPLIAGAGIIGVALGFGAQSLVRDFLSGLFMLAEDQYGVGDVIDVGEAIGTVEVVNIRTTRLRGIDGTVWHVPNGEILRVGNMSQQWARALLDISVAYDTDLDRAMEVVKEVADEMWREDEWRTQFLEEPEVWGVQALGADGITIRLVIKTQPGEQWSVTRELNRRMKDRFDDEGIEIPFPQRVMWMRRDEGSSKSVPLDDDPAQ
ncbi:MAG: mechanosensitive ion channel family protein [Acidimicrobiales bacterium]|nr:mechanosensitive ion channel family protein [Acidimicrobiales bacterium]